MDVVVCSPRDLDGAHCVLQAVSARDRAVVEQHERSEGDGAAERRVKNLGSGAFITMLNFCSGLPWRTQGVEMGLMDGERTMGKSDCTAARQRSSA